MSGKTMPKITAKSNPLANTLLYALNATQNEKEFEQLLSPLLKAGAENILTAQNDVGNTVLHLAVSKNYKIVTKNIISTIKKIKIFDKIINIENSDLHSPLDYIVNSFDKILIDLVYKDTPYYKNESGFTLLELFDQKVSQVEQENLSETEKLRIISNINDIVKSYLDKFIQMQNGENNDQRKSNFIRWCSEKDCLLPLKNLWKNAEGVIDFVKDEIGINQEDYWKNLQEIRIKLKGNDPLNNLPLWVRDSSEKQYTWLRAIKLKNKKVGFYLIEKTQHIFYSEIGEILIKEIIALEDREFLDCFIKSKFNNSYMLFNGFQYALLNWHIESAKILYGHFEEFINANRYYELGYLLRHAFNFKLPDYYYTPNLMGYDTAYDAKKVKMFLVALGVLPCQKINENNFHNSVIDIISYLAVNAINTRSYLDERDFDLYIERSKKEFQIKIKNVLTTVSTYHSNGERKNLLSKTDITSRPYFILMASFLKIAIRSNQLDIIKIVLGSFVEFIVSDTLFHLDNKNQTEYCVAFLTLFEEIFNDNSTAEIKNYLFDQFIMIFNLNTSVEYPVTKKNITIWLQLIEYCFLTKKDKPLAVTLLKAVSRYTEVKPENIALQTIALTSKPNKEVSNNNNSKNEIQGAIDNKDGIDIDLVMPYSILLGEAQELPLNYKTKQHTWRDSNGNTILHWLAINNQFKLAKQLIETNQEVKTLRFQANSAHQYPFMCADDEGFKDYLILDFFKYVDFINDSKEIETLNDILFGKSVFYDRISFSTFTSSKKSIKDTEETVYEKEKYKYKAFIKHLISRLNHIHDLLKELECSYFPNDWLTIINQCKEIVDNGVSSENYSDITENTEQKNLLIKIADKIEASYDILVNKAGSHYHSLTQYKQKFSDTMNKSSNHNNGKEEIDLDEESKVKTEIPQIGLLPR